MYLESQLLCHGGQFQGQLNVGRDTLEFDEIKSRRYNLEPRQDDEGNPLGKGRPTLILQPRTFCRALNSAYSALSSTDLISREHCCRAKLEVMAMPYLMTQFAA